MPDSAHPDTALILAALAGELPANEMDALAKRRSTDPEFEKKYRSCELEISILKAADRAEIKKYLKQEVSSSSGRTIPLWTWPLGLAAALVALFLIFQQSPPTHHPEQLALGYLEPISSGQARSVHASSEALTAYQLAEYQKVVDLWELKKDSLTTSEQLLLGSAYLQTEAYDLAEQTFTLLKDIPPYQDIAGWNLSLSLLLNSKAEKARPLLEKIAGSSHYRQKEASELLDKIR